MREIKFLVWDTKREEMCNDVTIFANGWTGCVFNNGDEWSYHPDTAIIKMQYTGLKDMDGKEIYEGFVIGNDTTHKLVVAIEKGHTVIKFTDLGTKYTKNLYQSDIDEMFYEVLGNIYENPELLDLAS